MLQVKEEKDRAEFKPKGAIAFFVVMVIFYLFLWLVFYFLMLGRN